MKLSATDSSTFMFLAKTKYIANVFSAYLGAIWPKPKVQVTSPNFNSVRPSVFTFESVGSSCDILEDALSRYQHIISAQFRRARKLVPATSPDNKWRRSPEYLGHLDSLKVDLKSACEKMPSLGMDESCEYQT